MSDTNKIFLSDLSEPTAEYVAKTFFTFQTYAFVTLYKYLLLAQNEVVRKVLTPAKLMVAMVLYALYPLCYIYGGYFTGQDSVSMEAAMNFWELVALMPAAGTVMLIVIAFGLKDAVMEEAERKQISNYQMNSFYLFLFNIFYINFCLNEIKSK